MPQIPFSLQCTIPESRLNSLKDSVNGSLYSLWVSNIPGFEYYLSIDPNGNNDARRGQARIGLHLNLGNVKKVEAAYTFTIESANYSFKDQYIYEKSIGHDTFVANTNEFFDPEKKFIVDGKCAIKVNGIFKWETEDSGKSDAEEQKWEGGELGDELWKKKDSKDFTLCVDGKELKIHKVVLGTRSDVFAALFESKMKESTESKIVIENFSFDVVKDAVKIIYDCNFVTFLSINEMMSLLQFFDIYKIQKFKDKVELLLIHQISASTVCRITNCSILTNSTKLKNKCMEFMIDCVSSKTALSDLDILDKDISMKVLQNYLCRVVEIP